MRRIPFSAFAALALLIPVVLFGIWAHFAGLPVPALADQYCFSGCN